MDYPKHLSEKIREEVAISYLKHELRKIFPSIETKEVENLMKCKTLTQPRDFWNGFHGISMGFKLNIGLIYAVTAKNIKWEKNEIPVDSLYFGSRIKELEEISEEGDLSVINISQNLDGKEELKNRMIAKYKDIKKINFQWDLDPIIVMEKNINNEGHLSVYDGHNRLLAKILNGEKEIKAFVGKYEDQRAIPNNYWLPTSLLMDNLYFVYEAIRNKDENLFKSQMKVINNMLRNSESGKIEFKERALTKKTELREKILAALE